MILGTFNSYSKYQSAFGDDNKQKAVLINAMVFNTFTAASLSFEDDCEFLSVKKKDSNKIVCVQGNSGLQIIDHIAFNRSSW